MSLGVFEKVARYSPALEYESCREDPTASMEEDNFGGYIDYLDYEILLNQYRELLDSIEVVNEVINKGAA